jgi:hypothetical protein
VISALYEAETYSSNFSKDERFTVQDFVRDDEDGTHRMIGFVDGFLNRRKGFTAGLTRVMGPSFGCTGVSTVVPQFAFAADESSSNLLRIVKAKDLSPTNNTKRHAFSGSFVKDVVGQSHDPPAGFRHDFRYPSHEVSGILRVIDGFGALVSRCGFSSHAVLALGQLVDQNLIEFVPPSSLPAERSSIDRVVAKYGKDWYGDVLPCVTGSQTPSFTGFQFEASDLLGVFGGTPHHANVAEHRLRTLLFMICHFTVLDREFRNSMNGIGLPIDVGDYRHFNFPFSWCRRWQTHSTVRDAPRDTSIYFQAFLSAQFWRRDVVLIFPICADSLRLRSRVFRPLRSRLCMVPLIKLVSVLPGETQVNPSTLVHIVDGRAEDYDSLKNLGHFNVVNEGVDTLESRQSGMHGSIRTMVRTFLLAVTSQTTTEPEDNLYAELSHASVTLGSFKGSGVLRAQLQASNLEQGYHVIKKQSLVTKTMRYNRGVFRQKARATKDSFGPVFGGSLYQKLDMKRIVQDPNNENDGSFVLKIQDTDFLRDAFSLKDQFAYNSATQCWEAPRDWPDIPCAGMINHSQRPNMKIVPFYAVPGQADTVVLVGQFLRDVEVDEELTIKYGTKTSGRVLRLQEEIDNIESDDSDDDAMSQDAIGGGGGGDRVGMDLSHDGNGIPGNGVAASGGGGEGKDARFDDGNGIPGIGTLISASHDGGAGGGHSGGVSGGQGGGGGSVRGGGAGSSRGGGAHGDDGDTDVSIDSGDESEIESEVEIESTNRDHGRAGGTTELDDSGSILASIARNEMYEECFDELETILGSKLSRELLLVLDMKAACIEAGTSLQPLNRAIPYKQILSRLYSGRLTSPLTMARNFYKFRRDFCLLVSTISLDENVRGIFKQTLQKGQQSIKVGKPIVTLMLVTAQKRMGINYKEDRPSMGHRALADAELDDISELASKLEKVLIADDCFTAKQFPETVAKSFGLPSHDLPYIRVTHMRHLVKLMRSIDGPRGYDYVKACPPLFRDEKGGEQFAGEETYLRFKPRQVTPTLHSLCDSIALILAFDNVKDDKDAASEEARDRVLEAMEAGRSGSKWDSAMKKLTSVVSTVYDSRKELKAIAKTLQNCAGNASRLRLCAIRRVVSILSTNAALRQLNVVPPLEIAAVPEEPDSDSYDDGESDEERDAIMQEALPVALSPARHLKDYRILVLLTSISKIAQICYLARPPTADEKVMLWLLGMVVGFGGDAMDRRTRTKEQYEKKALFNMLPTFSIAFGIPYDHGKLCKGSAAWVWMTEEWGERWLQTFIDASETASSGVEALSVALKLDHFKRKIKAMFQNESKRATHRQSGFQSIDPANIAIFPSFFNMPGMPAVLKYALLSCMCLDRDEMYHRGRVYVHSDTGIILLRLVDDSTDVVWPILSFESVPTSTAVPFSMDQVPPADSAVDVYALVSVMRSTVMPGDGIKALLPSCTNLPVFEDAGVVLLRWAMRTFHRAIRFALLRCRRRALSHRFRNSIILTTEPCDAVPTSGGPLKLCISGGFRADNSKSLEPTDVESMTFTMGPHTLPVLQVSDHEGGAGLSVTVMIPPGVGHANKVSVSLDGSMHKSLPIADQEGPRRTVPLSAETIANIDAVADRIAAVSEPIRQRLLSRSCSTTMFAYAPPIIASIAPAVMSIKGGRMVLSGENLGTDVQQLVIHLYNSKQAKSVRVNRESFEILQPHTSVAFTVSRDVGGPWDVIVEVANQESQSGVHSSFSRESPVITAIHPASVSPCGDTVRIKGAGFGWFRNLVDVEFAVHPPSPQHPLSWHPLKSTLANGSMIDTTIKPGVGVFFLRVKIGGLASNAFQCQFRQPTISSYQRFTDGIVADQHIFVGDDFLVGAPVVVTVNSIAVTAPKVVNRRAISAFVSEQSAAIANGGEVCVTISGQRALGNVTMPRQLSRAAQSNLARRSIQLRPSDNVGLSSESRPGPAAVSTSLGASWRVASASARSVDFDKVLEHLMIADHRLRFMAKTVKGPKLRSYREEFSIFNALVKHLSVRGLVYGRPKDNKEDRQQQWKTLVEACAAQSISITTTNLQSRWEKSQWDASLIAHQTLRALPALIHRICSESVAQKANHDVGCAGGAGADVGAGAGAGVGSTGLGGVGSKRPAASP